VKRGSVHHHASARARKRIWPDSASTLHGFSWDFREAVEVGLLRTGPMDVPELIREVAEARLEADLTKERVEQLLKRIREFRQEFEARLQGVTPATAADETLRK
jgi:hypothetical protein